jgi:iduronate 2-sulfatase
MTNFNSNNRKRSGLGAIICTIATFLLSACTPHSLGGKPNVLFIMIDDLRGELGVYGSEHALSPNIDSLAAQGTQFNNAYVSVPVCGASRASLITGMRALPDRFINYYTSVEVDAPDATTIFETFKNHGYHTVGYGKIFHNTQDTASKSWTSGSAWIPGMDQVSERNIPHDYQLPENIALKTSTGLGPATEVFDGPDDSYFDGQLAVKAMNTLTELSTGDAPFFLAVGFVKPHLPFNAPKKYWDLYSRDQFSLAAWDTLPEGAPIQAYHEFGELRDYSDTPSRIAYDEKFTFDTSVKAFRQKNPKPVSDELARRLIHGYHASVSYVDAQVGLVLDHLETLGLAENTIVVLMGDHGYSLGEHGLWCKHSTFDVATKTPLIIKSPGMLKENVVDGLVEFIDIFPTLTQLAEIETPEQVAGISLVGALKDPDAPTRAAVFPRYHSAEAIHTGRYTLTQWFDAGDNVAEQMLYDNEQDPDETKNLAYLPNYTDVLHELSAKLAAHRMSRE